VSRLKHLARPLYRRTAAGQLADMRAQLHDLTQMVSELHRVVMELNHEVRSGGEAALPLFMGAAERLRLDADTAIAATQVIERQLALLEAQHTAAPPHG
jgi:hypothetical protein